MVNVTSFDGPYGILIFGCLLVLAVQLLLCFKVKNVFLKLIPAVLLVLSTIGWYVQSNSTDPWIRVGCKVLSICSLIWLIVCGVCWVIWAVIRIAHKKKQ